MPKKKPEPTTDFTFPISVWKKLRTACFAHDAIPTGQSIQKRLEMFPNELELTIEVPLSHVFKLAHVCDKAKLRVGEAFSVVASSHAFPEKKDDGSLPAETMAVVAKEKEKLDNPPPVESERKETLF